jgi:prefoldin subunit 5
MPLHIREHIGHLQNDNASLMRRLNLVHQELERINREKAELQTQLSHWMKQSTDTYECLNKDDNVDRVNKYMKDDLLYERERNLKLKAQIQELNSAILQMADEVRAMEREQEQLIRHNQEISYVL